MYKIDGLTHAQELVVDDILAGTRRHTISGEITTLDGDPVDGLNELVTAYQTNVAANSRLGRSCTVNIIDPNRSLNLVDNAIYKQRILKLWILLWVPALDTRVRIPFFTGPFDSALRVDKGVAATAKGMALLAMRAIRDTKTIPANTRIEDIIYTILVHWAGLQPGTIHIPHIPERHHAPIHTTLNSRPLNILRDVLATIAYDDFWNGDGHWYTRQFPTTPDLEFAGGQNGTIIGRVERQETNHNFWNVFDAHGKNGLYAVAKADAASPLSAQSLKVTNTVGDVVLGWVPAIGQYPNTVHQDRLQQIADAQLAKGLDNAFTWQFTARTNYRLDEGDRVALNTATATGDFNVTNWSFSEANVMSVGYHRVLSLAGPRARYL